MYWTKFEFEILQIHTLCIDRVLIVTYIYHVTGMKDKIGWGTENKVGVREKVRYRDVSLCYDIYSLPITCVCLRCLWRNTHMMRGSYSENKTENRALCAVITTMLKKVLLGAIGVQRTNITDGHSYWWQICRYNWAIWAG